MSSLYPTVTRFSLAEFSRHGGLTAPHKDGWGIGFYHGKDLQLIREVECSSKSPHMAFIKENYFASHLVMSHIRHATQGGITLANTQPFMRELGGRIHSFAHNGHLKNLGSLPLSGRFQPVGETDSEQAFCYLLDQLSYLEQQALSIDARFEQVSCFAEKIRQMGPANFIYSDGDLLFVHGHRRQQRNSEIEPPGMHILCRKCSNDNQQTIRGLDLESGVSANAENKDQRVFLAASVPLTDEPWQALAEGELLMVQAGNVVKRV